MELAGVQAYTSPGEQTSFILGLPAITRFARLDVSRRDPPSASSVDLFGAVYTAELPGASPAHKGPHVPESLPDKMLASQNCCWHEGEGDSPLYLVFPVRARCVSLLSRTHIDHVTTAGDLMEEISARAKSE